MKNKKGSLKGKKRYIVLWIAIIIGVVTLILYGKKDPLPAKEVVEKVKVSPTPTVPKSTVKRRNVFMEAEASAPLAPVQPGMRPVLIYKNGKNHGMGTSIQTPDGERIVTARHIFNKESEQEAEVGSFYTFRRLSPRESELVPISSAKAFTNEGPKDFRGDGATCTVGVVTPIKPLSEIPRGHWIKGDYLCWPRTEGKKVTSLVSGQQYEWIAVDGTNTGYAWLMIMKETRGGESGSGFFLPDGILAVLHGHGDTKAIEIFPEEHRKMIGIPEETPISFLVPSVPIKFTQEKKK